MCCGSWGRKELDTTGQLKWNWNINDTVFNFRLHLFIAGVYRKGINFCILYSVTLLHIPVTSEDFHFKNP